MKRLLLTAALSITASVVFGQFISYAGGTHTKHNLAGNVLIGSTAATVAPLDKLEVGGNIRATVGAAGTGNLLFAGGLLHMNSTTSNFSLRLNATDRLTILNSNGNVGIGMSTPAYKLDILNSGGAAVRVNSGVLPETPPLSLIRMA